MDRDFASSVLYRGTVGSRHMEYLPGMFLTTSEKDGNCRDLGIFRVIHLVL